MPGVGNLAIIAAGENEDFARGLWPEAMERSRLMFLDGLDEMDQKIVQLLIKNARMSYSDIAQQVGISRVAVKMSENCTAADKKCPDVVFGHCPAGGDFPGGGEDADSGAGEEGDH